MIKPDKIDDVEYWENYYAARKEPFSPSLFARHVANNYLSSGMTLIELGCGNARDAVFLEKHGIIITAVDQCEKEIKFLSGKYQTDRLTFVAGDFTVLPKEQKYDCIYSRFTLHSISEAGLESLFNWISFVLNKRGFCFLEFRTLRNDLFGLGIPVEGCDDAFIYEGHYRRFLDIERVCDTLRELGMSIIESKEEAGFSPTETSDEVFGRIVARLD